MIKFFLTIITVILTFSGSYSHAAGTAGCCTKHGGVVCDGSTFKCKDGTDLSADCMSRALSSSSFQAKCTEAEDKAIKKSEKEKAAAEKAAEKERKAAEKAAEKERKAAEKAAEKERKAAEKAAAKEAAAAKKEQARLDAKQKKYDMGSCAGCCARHGGIDCYGFYGMTVKCKDGSDIDSFCLFLMGANLCKMCDNWLDKYKY